MEAMLMNIFTNTLDTILVFYFLIKIFQKRNNKNKVTIFMLAGLIAFSTMINYEFNLASFIGFIGIFVISTIVYSYLLNESIGKMIIYNILAIAIMFVIELTVANLIVVAFKIQPSAILELNFYKILALIIAKISFYLFIKYVVEDMKMPLYMDIKNKKIIILIGTFNILIIFIAFTLYKNLSLVNVRSYIYLMFMGVFVTAFSWVIYSIVREIIYQYQQEIIWKSKEEEFRKNDLYINSMKDILHTIKSQRHDLNNYLSVLYGLLAMKDYEEAKDYITKINNRIHNMNSIIETNNPVITALVSIKRNKAFEENIEMDLDLELPTDIIIEDVDLSIIIGNLLDNSIEACRLVEDNMAKTIVLNIRTENDNLIIESENTKSQSIKLNVDNITSRFTIKKEKEKHGLGLGNIEYIVNQYNGTMKVEDLGGTFRLSIEIPL